MSDYPTPEEEAEFTGQQLVNAEMQVIRDFCEAYPDSGVTTGWLQMLEDDPNYEEYGLNDYIEDLEERMFLNKISPHDYVTCDKYLLKHCPNYTELDDNSVD